MFRRLLARTQLSRLKPNGGLQSEPTRKQLHEVRLEHFAD